MLLFINISTDFIQILTQNWEKLIFRNDAESEFGPALLNIVKKEQIKKILVLNGPGGFTNLRVASLTINLLQRIEKDSLEIYDISKLDLYHFAIEKNILPNLWAVYIWQRKTLRLYDFLEKNYKVVKKEVLPYKEKKIFFDKVYDKDYFTENIVWRNIEFIQNWDLPELVFGDKKLQLDINSLPTTKVQLLTPNYMVKPVIWKW